jgi:[ribosomal protein S18]-alanine N-acetyltransferase
MHLDWYSLPELLRSLELKCWVGKDGTQVRTVVGATVLNPPPNLQRGDTPIAWLRLAGGESPDALASLWESLKSDLRADGVKQVVLLTMEPWIETVAKDWGFTPLNSVISLRRQNQPAVEAMAINGFTIRDAARADYEAIVRVDAAAFEPLWQYNLRTLELAQLHAATLTVLEKDNDLLGYQLSTWHIESGHLARLAIHPQWQGHGLGGLLIEEMLRFFEERDTHTITVNTQLDNVASQKLYERYGFMKINQRVGVWSLDLTK